MSPDPGPAAARSEEWLRWVFICSLVYAVTAMSVGWNHGILGLHGFRQTQTAMAIEYMLAGSGWLRYETPILGVPWSIPFEFPLFQWIVAGCVSLLGTPVAQTARFVSAGFFLAILAPLISLQGTLGVRGNLRLILPSLLLVSPIYIFWSRAVMIESTALFFATSFLALFAASLLRTDRKWTGALALAALCGALAAMVKITTFATFLLAGAVLFVVALRGDLHTGRRRLGLALMVGLAVPAIAGLAWSRFAEAQRHLNPIADQFLTGKAISTWFLGTLKDRLNVQSWETTLTRTVRDTVGNWGVVLGAAVLCSVTRVTDRRMFIASTALFLVAPALILHLHRTHEYYPYANAVFLIAAVSWAIIGALDGPPLYRRLGIGLLGLAFCSSVVGYLRFYHRVQVLDVTIDPGLVRAVQGTVGPGGVLLIYGSYWSTELPYSLHRRAIMNRDNSDLESPLMMRAREQLVHAGYRVEGLLSCARARADTGLIRRAASTLRFSAVALYRGSECDLYGVLR
jgi:4-amino-4-deoxy-L-arabinose transferase-like glycosyltransferase